MEIDFSAMNVGDERELPPGRWDDVREIYEAAQAYANSASPRPQFQFDELKERTRSGAQRWVIRRIR